MPLVSIDVIIVDATDTDMMESGISMGVGTEPGTSTGALSPGVDFSLNGSSVNKLINTFKRVRLYQPGQSESQFLYGPEIS
ncbi:MAG: hypothetical protein AB2L24_23805 [Mangrovibacterium sp.]